MRRAAAFVFALLLALFASGANAAPATEDSAPPSGPEASGPEAPDWPPPALADIDNNGISDDLQAKLATAHASDRFEVLVTFSGPGNAASARAAVGPFELHREFNLIQGFFATMTAGQARALAQTPGVFRVEDNVTVYAVLDGATDNYGINAAWPLLGGSALAGSSAGICIVDTGADIGHEQLDNGKVVAFFDAINGLTTSYDDHSIGGGGGHGTHVASIAAGGGGFSGTRFIQGVAPAANLYIAKGLNSAGSATAEQIIRSMEWCSEQPADIISMSIGTLRVSDGLDAMSAAVNCIADPAGSSGCSFIATGGVINVGDSDPKIVVVANGNSGPGEGTVGSPAAAEKSIAVGALSNWEDIRGGGQYLAGFSSRGPNLSGIMKPDISAPGTYIFAADGSSTNGYFSLSGTSMATPFTAGLIALLVDADPTLSVADAGGLPYEKALAILANTARDFGAPGADNEYGAGAIDGFLAVNEALGIAGATPTPFAAYHREIAFLIDGGEWFSAPFTVTAGDIETGIAMTVTIDGTAYCYWFPFLDCDGWGGWEYDPDFELELIDVATNAVVPAGSTDITVSTCPAAGEWCGVYDILVGYIVQGAGRRETVHYFPTAADVGKTFQARVYSFLGTGNFEFEMWRAPLGDGGGGPTNSQPIAGDDGATTDEEVAVEIDVLADDIDPDGDGLDIVSVTQGAVGVVVINDNGTGTSTDTVTYTPNLNATGVDSFTYTISDGALTDVATVTVTINGINDDPIAGDDEATTDEGLAVVINVLTDDTDPEGDGLDITSATHGAKGTVAINEMGAGDSTDTVTYTPNPGETGVDNFEYWIADGNGGSDSATVTVTINAAANQAPTANAGPDQNVIDADNNGAEDVTLDGSGSSDPDTGDTLTYDWSEGGATIATGVNPTVSLSVGVHTITLTVSDGGLSNTDTVIVTVTDPNDPPTANAGPDQTVIDADNDGAESVTLDGSGSSDP
ncbi:MAG: S8 family serine peptidase, partial [Proteobacteria bacterium]|nr:S8 family serine peptidase [Pseudomonadota bacterium]